jgi:hypothetical protein
MWIEISLSTVILRSLKVILYYIDTTQSGNKIEIYANAAFVLPGNVVQCCNY